MSTSQDSEQNLSLASYFCSYTFYFLLVALSLQPDNDALVDSAFDFITSIAPPAKTIAESAFSPLSMITFLAQLGMKPEFLAHACPSLEILPAPQYNLDAKQREDAFFRLFSVLAVLAKTGWILPNDIPDLVVGALLVGMDASVSLKVQKNVRSAVEALCATLSDSDADSAESLEALVFKKVLRLTRIFASSEEENETMAEMEVGLEVANQARLMDLFIGGCKPALRISRAVAHALITRTGMKDGEMEECEYAALPELDRILETMSEKRGVFDVLKFDRAHHEALQAREKKDNEASDAGDGDDGGDDDDAGSGGELEPEASKPKRKEFDYVELNDRMVVLAKALSGIADYVKVDKEEARARKERERAERAEELAVGGGSVASSRLSGSKGSRAEQERELTGLEAVKVCLDGLHGRIGGCFLSFTLVFLLNRANNCLPHSRYSRCPSR